MHTVPNGLKKSHCREGSARLRLAGPFLSPDRFRLDVDAFRPWCSNRCGLRPLPSMTSAGAITVRFHETWGERFFN